MKAWRNMLGAGLGVFLMSCGQPSWEGQPAVVVLVLDGVRPEESLGDEHSTATGEHPADILPQVWDTLIEQGARATHAINAGITITTPAHLAMLSGLRQPIANYPVAGDVGLYLSEHPTVLTALLDQQGLASDQAMLLGNTSFIEPAAASLWPTSRPAQADFQLTTTRVGAASPAEQDGPVFEHILSVLRSSQPRLLVANLHGADRAGHHGEGEAYIDTVRTLDQQLVSFWEAFQTLPGYKDTGTVIIVADHGRHRVDEDDDPPWRNHGDACTGCRRVPLLFLGSGVDAGTTHTDPVMLPDVGATIAALLNVSLPSATGLPLLDMIAVDSPPPLPTGTHTLTAVDGVQGEIRLQADPHHRSAIFVDDEQLSDADALAAEGLALAVSSAGLWACFRELHLDMEADQLPWQPRCLLRPPNGSWQALPAPMDAVGPFWQPVLHADSDSLTLWGVRNPTGTGNLADGLGDIGVFEAVYTGDDWLVSPALTGLSFPDKLAVLPDGSFIVVASPTRDTSSRHTRRLYRDNGRALSMASLLGDTEHRVERPALGWSADGVSQVAALVHTPDETLLVTGSLDGIWQPAAVSLDAAVLPHVSPVWTQDPDGQAVLLFMAMHTDGAHQLCAMPPSRQTVCQGTDATAVHHLSVDGDTAHLTVRDEEGAWTTISLSWPSIL